MHTIAAPGMASAIGTVPASGIALVLLVVLIYGVIGKGKKKLASGPAQVVGILAEIAFLRSPGTFGDFGEAIQAVPQSIATAPALGAIGMTATLCVFVGLALFARIVPATGAVLGLMIGAALQMAPGSLCRGLLAVASLPIDFLAS